MTHWTSPHIERDRAIADAHAKGELIASLAERYELKPARVQQIVRVAKLKAKFERRDL